MPANGRRDLIRRLKVNAPYSFIHPSLKLRYLNSWERWWKIVSIKGWGYFKPMYSRWIIRQAMYIWRKIDALSRYHFCRAGAMIVTQSDCVSVAVVTQYAKGMRRNIRSFVACLTVPYFSTLSHKRHDFLENGFGHKICVLVVSRTFASNISLFKSNL